MTKADKVAEWKQRNPHRRVAQTRRHAARLLARREALAGRPRPTVCELCGQPSSNTIEFDHDHSTRQFRGWLCHRCNKVLGLVKENVQTLQRMVDYLNAGGIP